MFVVKLYNPSNKVINAMFDGTPYTLAANGVTNVPEEAAKHFVTYYSALGLRVLNDGEDSEVVMAHDADEPEEESQDAVICPVCGKDFSDRDRPSVALKRHMKAAHETGEPDGNSTATDV
jgi:hypothetical protein